MEWNSAVKGAIPGKWIFCPTQANTTRVREDK